MRGQTKEDRARVAAELSREAEELLLTSSGEHETPARPNAATAATASSPAVLRTTDGERALAALDRALAEQADSVPLRLERAALLAATGRYAAAQRDIGEAMTLAPEDQNARLALGLLLMRRGLWGEAVPQLRQVLASDGAHAATWFHLGEALNHIDDLQGALAAYGRAVEIDPQHAKALFGLGVVYDRLRRPNDATAAYRRAREASRR
ncbi:MAG TPA: tetratricopeptide repeat protein [Gemmatimonadales bacterium]|nr:tetratricopeptide repeat protein [Gemmatimonadales bacterium]